MCDICGRLFCAESCPEYLGKRPNSGRLIGVCRVCNKRLYLADDLLRWPHLVACRDCGSESDELKDAWQLFISKPI